MENKKHQRHEELLNKLHDLYIKKNEDYEDTFGKTFQAIGIASAYSRMYDKFGRIQALILGKEQKVADEKLEDTLLDMANYCIMTLIELEVQHGELKL